MEPWYEHLYAVLHDLLRRALTPPAGQRPGRALDAGCGTGLQAIELAGLGYAVAGVDISSGLLAVARGRGLAVARAALEALPFADGAFDVVSCCGSTLSYVDAPPAALRELGRVLRPGGRLLLECEHKWSLDLGWMLLGGLAGDALGYGIAPRVLLRSLRRPLREGFRLDYLDHGSLRLFTRPELRDMLAEAGLGVERTWGIHALTNLIPSTVLHRPRLSRPAAALFRALAAADRGLRRLSGAAGFANSLVVLARKRADGTRTAVAGGGGSRGKTGRTGAITAGAGTGAPRPGRGGPRPGGLALDARRPDRR